MSLFKLPGAVLAASLAAAPQYAIADGWYGGLDVGTSEADAEISGIFGVGPATQDSEASSTGFRVRAGYRFSDYFAVEAGYADFGDFEFEFDPDTCDAGGPDPCPFDATTSISALMVSAVGSLPIGDHWALYARAGGFRMRVRNSELATAEIDASTTKDGFHVGIGAGYRIDDHWELLLDFTKYEQLDFGLAVFGAFGYYDFGDTRLTSLGVNYRW